jgi:hypothetical protein
LCFVLQQYIISKIWPRLYAQIGLKEEAPVETTGGITERGGGGYYRGGTTEEVLQRRYYRRERGSPEGATVRVDSGGDDV